MTVLQPQPFARRPTQHRVASSWVVGTTAVLLLIAALTAGLVIGRATAPERAGTQPLGLATAAIDKTLADRIQAINSGDVKRLTSIYAPEAVLEERDQVPAVFTRGNIAIAEHLARYYGLGFRLKSESVPVQVGSYVAEGARWSGGVTGILVYSFDAKGRIVYQWVIT